MWRVWCAPVPGAAMGAEPDVMKRSPTAPGERRWRILGLLLVVASLAFLAYRVRDDWRAVDLDLLSLAPAPLAVHLALTAAAFVLLVAGWHLLLTAFGARPPIAGSAYSWFLGGLARYIPGKVASLVGRVAACHRYGVSPGTASTALAVEQILYAAIGLGFLVVAVPASWLGGGPTLPLAGIALVVVLVTTLLVDPGLLHRLAARLPGGLAVGLDGRRLHRRRLLAGGAVILAGWSLYGVAGFFLVQALHPLPLSDLPRVALAFLGAWALGYLAFLVPAGLGVREAALAVLLAPLLPAPLDVVVSIASRLSWVAVELAGAAVATMVVRHRWQTSHEEGA